MLKLSGHAIVSADGKIADQQGLMPEALRNDEDWRHFQAALDASVLVVLGSLGHRRHRNTGRKRLVMTSHVAALQRDETDPLAHLWNPAGLAWADVRERLGLTRGTAVIAGGMRVLDHFLTEGFDEFWLSEVNDYVLPDGIGCFSSAHPRIALAQAGLVPQSVQQLPGLRSVSLTQWRRAE